MGHYDTCREGYCPGCGQAEGVVWGCGHEHCAKFHQHLRNTGQHDRLKRILDKQRARAELQEEERVTKRQIARRTAQIAREAREEAEA